MNLDVHYRGFVITPVKTDDTWTGAIRRLDGEEFRVEGMTLTSIETISSADIQTAVGTARVTVDEIIRTGGGLAPGK